MQKKQVFFDKVDIMKTMSDEVKIKEKQLSIDLEKGRESITIANKLLKKRIQTNQSKLEKKKTVEDGIVSQNCSQTWDEMLKKLEEAKTYHGVELDQEDAYKIKNFIEAYEDSFGIDDILVCLDRPSTEARSLTKLIVENLPVMAITSQG